MWLIAVGILLIELSFGTVGFHYWFGIGWGWALILALAVVAAFTAAINIWENARMGRG